MRTPYVLRVLLTSFLLFGLAVTAKSQAGTGEVLGIVKDQSGAVIPSATIQLTSQEQGWTRTTTTSSAGLYDFPAVPVGHYTIRVQKSGFQAFTQSGITLQTDMQAKVDVALRVGATSSVVTVSANAVQLQTTSSTGKTVVDRERVQNLPLNGRDARQLISLVAGGIERGPVDQFISSPSFSVNGANQDQVNFLLDGGEHMDTWFGSGLSYPNPDALQEFTVETNNFSAKYGRNAGAIVDAVIRSGTNEFHGSLFEYLRNDVLDSRPFFAANRPKFRRNQFGASVGGPVMLPGYNGKDKTFWFFAWQTTREVGSPGVATYTTLSQTERSGILESAKPIIDPSTGEPFPTDSQGRYIIPPTRLSVPVQNFMNKYLPLPTGPNNADTFPRGGFNNDNQFVARFDHQLSPKDSLSFSYYYDRPLGLTSYGAGIGPDQNWFDDFRVNSQSFTLNQTHSFSPTVLNHVNLTIEIERHLLNPRTVFTWRDLGSNLSPADNSPFPDNSVNVSGYFGTYSGFHWDNGRNNPFLSDELSIVRGRHTLSFGLNLGKTTIWNRTPFFIDGSATFNGQFTGDPRADFLLGDISSFTQLSRNEIDLRQFRMAYYAQDSFKVTSRLTLNLGLRCEPYFPFFETHGRAAFWAPGQQSTRFPNAPLGQLFAFDNNPVIPNRNTIVTKDWNNLAPRVGFAWDPTGQGKWAIRGGYGIFYNGLNIGIRTIRGIYNQPFTRAITVFNTNIIDPYAAPPFNGDAPFPYSPPTTPEQDKTVPFAPGGNVVGWDAQFVSPYTQQYNFNVQRQLATDWLVEIGYVGSTSTKEFYSHNINPAVYIPGVDENGNPLSTPANTQSRRLYPNLGAIELESTAANQNYNSLQLKLDKRFSKGLTLMGSYVFSKDLGWNVPLGEGGGGTRDPFNARLDYGLLNQDVTHRFVMSYIWQLPQFKGAQGVVRHLVGGWGTNGILTWQSGFPFTVRCGCDNSRTGVFQDTADQIGDPNLAGDRPLGAKLNEWFDTAAFRPNAVGTFGTTGINTLRGPGFFNMDFAVTKKIPITESQNLNFRAEFFNVFNHPSFGNPISSVSAGGLFGRILSANGSPRVIEFALRYAF